MAAQAAGWLAVLAGYRAARVDPAAAHRPWISFVGALALTLLAGLLHAVLDRLGSPLARFPGPAEVLYAAGYALLLRGLARLRHLRAGASDVDGLLDGLLAATAVGYLIWAFVLAPYATDATVPLSDRLTNVAFSTMALLVLAVAVRVAVGPGVRSVPYWLLMSAVVAFIATDLASTVSIKVGGVDAAMLVAPTVFALWGAALTHPDRWLLTEPPTGPSGVLRPGRIVAFSGALLLVPVVVLVQHAAGHRHRLVEAGVASVLLSALVVARLARIVGASALHARHERALRRTSARLVASTSRADMTATVLQAVHALAPSVQDLRVSAMTVARDGTLTVEDSVGLHAAASVGTTMAATALPQPLKRALVERTPAALPACPAVDLPPGPDPRPRALLLVPLVTQGALRGALVVSSRAPLAEEVHQSIESLAAVLSLALESATLTEAIHRTRNERRFRLLVEHASDLVLVLSDRGEITFASPASHRLLGLRPEELLATTPLERIHADDRPLAEAVLVKRRGEGDVHGPLELRIQHRDGSWRWFEVLARDVGPSEDLHGSIVNCRDISDRKEAELEVVRSEARFRALVQNVGDVVAVLDDRGRFTYVSPAVTAMLGFRPEELLGVPVTHLLPADHPRPGMRASSDPFGLGRPAGLLPAGNIEVRVRAASGEWRTLDVMATDLRTDPAVHGVVLNVRDVTLRRELEQTLHHQSRHDSLTGLANRHRFAELVDEALAGLAEEGAAPAETGVLFVDLDDFKTVNDSLGHAVGDSLVLAVAERLAGLLPPECAAARLGGDEFAVLAAAAPGDELGPFGLALRLLDELRRPFPIDGHEIFLTASIGLAALHDPAATAEVVLRNADTALHLAKERGKDRVELFEERMHATAFERLELRTHLSRAVDAGQLRLRYQPVVDLASGRITGVEALLRWNHPERGLLGPDLFVPFAEESGLIVDLGSWVLEEACRQLRSWQRTLPGSLPVGLSANLSVRQLERDTLVAEVARVIDDTGVDPSSLTLEITESVVVADTELAGRRLRELKALGVRLAVDDFGTGYSSLRYVEHFPIDIIKIDRSFVGRVRGGRATPVVESMIQLGRRLGTPLVAEGIERRDQLQALRRLGCQFGQGFLFAEPLEADQVTHLLRTGGRSPETFTPAIR
ncbi:MAG: EAL domain-containing protein [Actinobacteria bacterium]|nr:EAL domain-containing protein [Actinomycetota bacterium]